MTIDEISKGRPLENIPHGTRETIVGTLEEVEDTSITHFSGGIVGKWLTLESSNLKIRSGEESYTVLFPQKISYPQGTKIVGKKVMYVHEHTSFDEEDLGDLVGDDYRVELLEGPDKGLVYKKGLVN